MAKDKRLFARLDLDYADHPKIAGLSDAAFRAHIELILYARKYETDGLIGNRHANRVGSRWDSEVITELLSNDPDTPSLCRLVSGDFLLHGFTDMQESKAEITARKQKNAENGRRGGRPKQTQSVSDSVSHSLTQSGTQIKAETETETETLTTPKGVVPRKRGTRITEDFEVTPEMVSWAAKEASLVDGKRATEKFINHFMAKSGRDATKVDWVRTWKNWLLNDQERAEQSPAKKSKDEQIVDVLEQGKRMQEEHDRKAIGQ